MPDITAPEAAATKHTAGPWHAEGPDMFGDFNILHQADALAVGAAVRNLRTPAEVAANAALIASAPRLLEAVDHPLLRQLFGEIEDSGTPEAARLWALAQAWFEVRDAAIAAAEAA